MTATRTSAYYFIPPGKLTLVENALGQPDLIQASVAAGCTVTLSDTERFPLTDDEQYRSLRLSTTNIRLNGGPQAHYIYLVVPTLQNGAVVTATLGYNTALLSPDGYEILLLPDGTTQVTDHRLGIEGFVYYRAGIVGAHGSAPEASVSPARSGRTLTLDLGTTPPALNLPGGLADLERVFHIERTQLTDPSSWWVTVVSKITSMVADTVNITGKLLFGTGNAQKEVTTVATAAEVGSSDFVADTVLASTAWVSAQFEALSDRFLRKDVPDVAHEDITFEKDIHVQGTVRSPRAELNTVRSTDIYIGDYHPGELGSGAAVTTATDGTTSAEVDFLTVRRRAIFTGITVKELKQVGGQLVLTPAAMECAAVLRLPNGDYRCSFRTDDGKGRRIFQEFVVGDQARCQTFNLSENKYYWRLVVEVGDDYIVLSDSDKDAASSAPAAGDAIVQLGNRTDPERQNAVILSAFGPDAPSYKQYAGINSYSLVGCEVTRLSPAGNRLTGIVNIQAGSSGAANLLDLPEEIRRLAADPSMFSYGNDNLLRNTAFTGDYDSVTIGPDAQLSTNTELFSKGMGYWQTDDAQSVECSESKSGRACSITDGWARQHVAAGAIPGQAYILTFRARGAELSVYFADVTQTVPLTDAFERYEIRLQAQSEDALFELSGRCVVCELMLERGTIASTAWVPSILDNDPAVEKMQAYRYLASAISEGDTNILGGLILSNVIQLGNFRNGKMLNVTSGLSGIWNNNNDVAFWAGGTLEQAIHTVMYYLSNPTREPSEEELKKMARAVITHGGRSILQDIILRGYIYAEGGVFRGKVYAQGGEFIGLLTHRRRIITPEKADGLYAGDTRWFDILKIGAYTIFEGYYDDYDGFPSIYLPSVPADGQTDYYSEDVDLARSMVGQKILCYNRITHTVTGPSDDAWIYLTGQDISFTGPRKDPKFKPGEFIVAECKADIRGITVGGETVSAERIYWEVVCGQAKKTK